VRHWLMKSEPEVYSIEDFQRDKTTFWDGVRNYQARNFMRDTMAPGDLVFFYHSNAEPAGIAGIAEVKAAGRPDESAFDKKSPLYDPDSDPAKPAWYGVDLKFVEKFPRVLALDELRRVKGLEKMALLQKGQRLSVQPVSAGEWKIITGLAAD
jgi:predicted RNA-binding protein with PUA-like domain